MKLDSKKCLLWALAVAGLTAVFFLPALQGEFLHWDDHALFVENPYYRGLSPSHWQWMCTTFLLGHWQPLSWLSCALDFKLWGMNPHGWHLTNLLIHAFNAVLVYWLCLAFLKDRFRCGAAALAVLFWAIHPLRTEAVVWLATRGYLLCTTFCLLTVIFYLKAACGADTLVCSFGKKADRNVCPILYLAALLCFALATFTKGIGMMLPLVLLLIDRFPLRRITSLRSAFFCAVEKIPFFALSLLTGVMAFWSKNTDGGMAPVELYGPVQRVGQAVYGIWFYLLKTVFPLNLSPLYYKRAEAGPVLTALVLTAAAGIFLFLFRRKLFPIIGTFGAFLLLIFPMLGFTQSGVQTAADRFTYLAAVPFSILLAAGLARLPVLRRTVGGALAALLLIFGIQTFIWAGVWSDSLLLWNQAAAMDGGNARAYNGMGQAFMDRKAYVKAIECFDKALLLQPRFLAAYQNRALVLAETGEYEKAVQDISAGLALDGVSPIDRAKMLLGRGQIAEKTGNTEQALNDYSAVADDPAVDPFWKILALQTRARLHLLQGNLNAGRADLEAVLQLPDPTGEYRSRSEQILDELKKIPGE